MPDLLPPNATIQERAISLSVDRLPTVPIKTLWTPATCPEAQLPWLAWALSVDEWDAAWPIETKREVIAASIEQHRKKGTVGALRRALQRLGYEVEIDEATGLAYTFKIRVRIRAGESAGGSVSEDVLNRSIAIALRHKNARSFLSDTLYVADTDAARLFVGGVTLSGLEYESRVTEEYTLPPSGLLFDQNQAAKISVSWSGFGEYYEIEIRPQSNTSDVYLATVYSNSIDDLIFYAGNYEFKIRAYADGYFSPWTIESFDVIILPPTDITSSNPVSQILSLTWTDAEGEAEVQLKLSSNNWNDVTPILPNVLNNEYADFYDLNVDSPPVFYDARIRSKGTAYPGPAYPNVDAYSEWIELNNIEII
jgi:phage tail P2-like protein